MRLRNLTAMMFALCALAGCQGGGQAELLERELRLQEDRIYRLEDELDSLDSALEASRRENQSLKRELAGEDKGAGGRFAPSKPTRKAPVEKPAMPQVELPELEPPVMEAPKTDAPATPADPEEPPPLFKSTSTSEAPLRGDPRSIERLVLNKQLTGGWNPDHRRGDDGIFVVVEPRDGKNKLVEATGDVSIVVLDPGQTGAAARVARWDFAADEAAKLFRRGPLARGMQFELPWPSGSPANAYLQLYVRLTTSDGRQVETDSKLRVAPADLQAGTWQAKPQAIVPAQAVEATPPLKRPEWAPER